MSLPGAMLWAGPRTGRVAEAPQVSAGRELAGTGGKQGGGTLDDRAQDNQAKAGASQGSKRWGVSGARSRLLGGPCEAGSLEKDAQGSTVEDASREEELEGAKHVRVVAEVACKQALGAYNMAVSDDPEESLQGKLVDNAEVRSMVQEDSLDSPVHTVDDKAGTMPMRASCMDSRLVTAGMKKAHFRYPFAYLGPFIAEFDSSDPELAAWLDFVLDL